MASSPFVDGGFNCISTITNYLSGDWAALQKCADAIRNLAEYNTAYKEAINVALSDSNTSWQGNAAESAREFFSSLTNALENQVEPMTTVADEISAYAMASYGMANGIADLVQTLGDLAIKWVASEIAAATAASSGVGAGAAAALHAVANAILAIMALQISDIIGRLGHMVNASEALLGVIVAGMSAAVEASEIPALTTDSYDHPGVQR